MAHNTAIVLMGVSGAGKSTIGVRLAQQLGRAFLEGDAFHPPANVEKMRQSVPLDDHDRLPWLSAIAAAIDAARREGRQVVVTCSALKRSYRTILSAGHDDVAFIYLKGDKDLIAERLGVRSGHFMPPQLLDSQFAALEEPISEEHAVTMSVDDTPDRIVSAIAVMFAARART
jgi:carbohydrate kinase (thermoresistant glucokinase family)